MWLYVLILCLILSFIKLTKNSNFWVRKNVRSESHTFWKFITGNCSLPEIYRNIYRKYPREPYVGMFLGATPALLIRDLENMQAILASDFQNFSSRGFITNPRDILADNLLFINNYRRWKLVRHTVKPIFTTASIKKMFFVLDRCAHDFVSMMSNLPEMREKPFNAMYTYSTASIGASFFGIDTQVSNTMESPFMEMSWETLKASTGTNLKFCLANTSERLFNLLNIKFFGRFETFIVGAINKALELRRQSTQTSNDFIDLCLKIQASGTIRDSVTNYEIEPTNEILGAQAFVFFIAGTDSSANTMHFTLLELSYNPDILTKVHEEIDNIFDKCNENITYDDIIQLTYLAQVIKEVLRKYPPIGRIQRKCTHDTTLPAGNVKIEKDVLMVIPTLALHRDENYFPNPDKFDPDRFSTKNIAKIKKWSYLPFGEGYRNCIGLKFVQLQVVAGLARLLRKYSVKPQDSIPAKFEKCLFNIRGSNAHYDLYLREGV